MKTADHEIRVVPSVFDRLLDLKPKSDRDELPTRDQSVDAYRASVQRDLESLLNARNTFFDLSPDFVEAGQSVLTHGLPDFGVLSSASDRDQVRVRQAIENAIRIFEPRLTGVTATLATPTATDRAFRLRVEARLLMDPSPQTVAFDIVRLPHTVKYEVKERE